MLKLLSAAALAACLCVPHAYADDAVPAAPAKPACETLDQSRTNAHAVADQNGLGIVDLDGDAAHRYLAYINGQGDPTDFKGDHISIIIAPDRDLAMVVLNDGPCGGYSSAVKLHLKMAMDAYQAARGTGT